MRKEVETQNASMLAHIDYAIDECKDDPATYKRKKYSCRRCGMPKKGHICSV
jgi:hypothetical protein